MKILVNGCSYTAGYGLDLEKNDPRLWVNQLFKDHEVTNLAKSGYNNHSIFVSAAEEIVKEDYDLAVIAWSSIPRWNANLGFESYSTLTRFTNELDINLNPNYTISKKWLEDTGDRLRKFHNDHWDILDLVRYVNILIKLTNQKVVFVNGLGPWCNNYFRYKDIVYPSELDVYIQKLLQTETRDDKEICNLYKLMHQSYANAGGIREEYWLNLYSSLRSIKIDDVSATNVHPGYLSQDLFVELFRPKIKKFI
jgi:hypothetical protein